MSARGKEHTLDGRSVTMAEAAEMLGISRKALYAHMFRQKPASLQLVADMIRAGELGTNRRRLVKHRVHGAWMTLPEAAALTGASINALETWRQTHRRPDGGRALLEEAVDHYMAIKTGEIPRYTPRECRKYWVRGKQRTIAEAGALIGVSEASVRRYISVHRCSVETAIKRLDEWHKKRAAREIMKILNGE